jgi:hypothetical protein
MGQAAIDLPDPLQKTNAGTAGAAPAAPDSQVPSAASADDLLSQLASDEIDRLLADADDSPSLTIEPAPAAQSESKTIIEPPKPAKAEPAAELSRETLDEAIAAEAEDIAPVANDPSQSATVAPPAEVKSLGAALTSAINETLSTADATTSPAEREALSSLGTDACDDEAATAEISIPVYLKPLQWLSAPMLILPESLRDALGKVALLTLFNAVAVLLYVLIFRRPHH